MRTVAELAQMLADLLGNTWQPKIDGRFQLLVSPEYTIVFERGERGWLRFALYPPTGRPVWVDVNPRIGPGEMTQHIRDMLSRYRAQLAEDAEKERRRAWREEWIALFEGHADALGLHVEFDIDESYELIVSMRAAFYSRARTSLYVAFTVSPDGFPARVEYYTANAELRAQLAIPGIHAEQAPALPAGTRRKHAA